MTTFKALMPSLDAIMPAHVIYENVDPNPAGFSPFWIQEILRGQLGFDGVLFSDDLSMQAACVAGGADARIQAALQAGCDMGLVCNDRQAACVALEGIQNLALPNQARLERMRGHLLDFNTTQAQSEQWKMDSTITLGETWRTAKNQIEQLL